MSNLDVNQLWKHSQNGNGVPPHSQISGGGAVLPLHRPVSSLSQFEPVRNGVSTRRRIFSGISARYRGGPYSINEPPRTVWT